MLNLDKMVALAKEGSEIWLKNETVNHLFRRLAIEITKDGYFKIKTGGWKWILLEHEGSLRSMDDMDETPKYFRVIGCSEYEYPFPRSTDKVEII